MYLFKKRHNSWSLRHRELHWLQSHVFYNFQF